MFALFMQLQLQRLCRFARAVAHGSKFSRPWPPGSRSYPPDWEPKGLRLKMMSKCCSLTPAKKSRRQLVASPLRLKQEFAYQRLPVPSSAKFMTGPRSARDYMESTQILWIPDRCALFGRFPELCARFVFWLCSKPTLSAGQPKQFWNLPRKQLTGTQVSRSSNYRS